MARCSRAGCSTSANNRGPSGSPCRAPAQLSTGGSSGFAPAIQNLLHHFLARERVEGVGQVYLKGDNAFVAMHTCAHCMALALHGCDVQMTKYHQANTCHASMWLPDLVCKSSPTLQNCLRSNCWQHDRAHKLCQVVTKRRNSRCKEPSPGECVILNDCASKSESDAGTFTSASVDNMGVT